MIQNIVKRMKREEGFTLVELLIVVAIIAILAAIAIPQFSQYRKRGYAATMNSDIKNAYTAAQAYLVDNPTAATVTAANMQSAGYTPSDGLTVTASDISTSAGGITITGPDWGLTTGTTVSVNYLGDITKATP